MKGTGGEEESRTGKAAREVDPVCVLAGGAEWKLFVVNVLNSKTQSGSCYS